MEGDLLLYNLLLSNLPIIHHHQLTRLTRLNKIYDDISCVYKCMCMMVASRINNRQRLHANRIVTNDGKVVSHSHSHRFRFSCRCANGCNVEYLSRHILDVNISLYTTCSRLYNTCNQLYNTCIYSRLHVVYVDIHGYIGLEIPIVVVEADIHEGPIY